MINLNAAAVYQNSRHENAENLERGRAVLALLDSGMDFRDIIDALNCDGDVLMTTLLDFTRSLQRAGWISSGLELLSDGGQRVPICRPGPGSTSALRDRENLARHLRSDVLEWLMTFNLPAADRCDVIDQAASFLADVPTDSGAFSADRSIAEVLGLWTEDTSEEEFNILAARWLASWIRFWVSDPAIWTRELELATAELRPGSWPKTA